MNNQQVATHDKRGQAVAEPRLIDVFRRDLQVALPTIQKLLPAHVTPEKFQAMMVGAVLANTDLLNVDRGSLMQAVADTADLGLSLNKQLHEADILLVQGKAQMRPRYEGLVKLARQSGEIVDIYAHEVYANDRFEYSLGLDKKLVHEPPADGDRGELLQLAYCVWTTKHGVKGFEVIGAKRIAAAKAASEGYKAYKAGKIKSTPWVDHEAQMLRKTAIRAAAPYLPKSTESDKFQRALAMSDDSSFDEADHVGVPSEPRVMPPPPKPTRESVKAAQERQRKEDVARRSHARDIHREDPRHDEATGEIEGEYEETSKQASGGPAATAATSEPKAQSAKTSQPAAAARAQEPEPEPEPEGDPPMTAKQFADFLIKKLVNEVKSQAQLKAVETDYADDLARLQEDAPAEYDRVKKAMDGKRTHYAAAPKR